MSAYCFGDCMTTYAEFENYMDKIEERYFTLHSDPISGPRQNWLAARNRIARVKEGEVSGVTMETDLPPLTSDYWRGLRRELGEELHPRKKIRTRQLMNLSAAGFDCAELYERDKAMRAEDAARRAAKKVAAGFS
jgi:hypothetical protein